MLWFHRKKWVAQFLTTKMTGNGMNKNPENWQCETSSPQTAHFNFNDDSGCQISKPGVQNSKQEQSTIKNWLKLEVFKNLNFFNA